MPSPASRSLYTAVSCLDAAVEGLRSVAPRLVCVRSVSVPSASRVGDRWVAGGGGVGGERLCGGGWGGCWCLIPSQPVQDILVSQRQVGGDRLIPPPAHLSSSLPHPPKTTNLSYSK